MKRIFAFFFAIFMALSIVVVSNAGFISAKKGAKEEIKVTANIGYRTPVTTSEVFSIYPSHREGRKIEIIFNVENNTKDIVKASDILDGFSIMITNRMRGLVELWYMKGAGTGWGNLNRAINPGEVGTFKYTVCACYTGMMNVDVAYGLESYWLNSGIATWTLVKEAEPIVETTTAAPVETTTAAPEKVEPKPEPKLETKKNTVEDTNDYSFYDKPDYAKSALEIPDTGSKAIAKAIAALVIAIAAAVVLIKKED